MKWILPFPFISTFSVPSYEFRPLEASVFNRRHTPYLYGGLMAPEDEGLRSDSNIVP